MLTIHHLRIGRSIFTVWLLEELECDYSLIEYHRDPETMRAPPELKNAHPLGKSPVIDDGGLVLSESGAITSYLLKKYDTEGKFAPDEGLEAWAEYTQWLHYAEGSVFLPLFLKLLSMRAGDAAPIIDAFADPEVALHFEHITKKLGDNAFILGDRMTGADFGITYMVSMAERLGQLGPYPELAAYLARNTARPAFQRALERGVE